jgi:hypothetical protein
MPHKRGPGTYKGFQSPDTAGWPAPIRQEVRKVYGAYREKHPQEDRKVKARGAQIAWSAARRKYPKQYRAHVSMVNREARQEHKEHPWLSREGSRRVAQDHIRERAQRRLRPVTVHPAKTERMRKYQIADLHTAARQERKWAKTAHNEMVSERKRAERAKAAGHPVLAKDLKEDSKVAGDFEKIRIKKADTYDLQAEREAYVKKA